MSSERVPSGQLNIFSASEGDQKRGEYQPQKSEAEDPGAYLSPGEIKKRKRTNLNLARSPREAFHKIVDPKPGDQPELFKLHDMLGLAGGRKRSKRKRTTPDL